MNRIFEDIKTAVRVTGEIRKARKAGANAVQIRPVYRIPVVKLDYWCSTMEFCLFYTHEKEYHPVMETFNRLPEELQHALTFSPSDEVLNGWTDRAKFWALLLRPVLPPDLYHDVMLRILQHYSKCRRYRLENGGQNVLSDRSRETSRASAVAVRDALLAMEEAQGNRKAAAV